jgi:hypothetical protein
VQEEIFVLLPMHQLLRCVCLLAAYSHMTVHLTPPHAHALAHALAHSPSHALAHAHTHTHAHVHMHTLPPNRLSTVCQAWHWVLSQNDSLWHRLHRLHFGPVPPLNPNAPLVRYTHAGLRSMLLQQETSDWRNRCVTVLKGLHDLRSASELVCANERERHQLAVEREQRLFRRRKYQWAAMVRALTALSSLSRTSSRPWRAACVSDVSHRGGGITRTEELRVAGARLADREWR